MKSKALHLIYICTCVTLILMVSCKDDDEPLPSQGLPGVTLQSTLIFYIVGENSLANYMAADTLEIAAALSQIPEDARVVVYIDDHISSRISVGTRHQPMQCVKTYPDNVCSTDSAGMLMVLRDIMQAYPARHYALACNSHASGWLLDDPASKKAPPRRSFGIDNGRRSANSNSGVKMNIPTMARVLKQLPHFDYILFDACFMQCVEVAYELRHVTDFLIGSPAEIPGDGAPYDIILPQMCQLPATKQTVAEIVKGYGDYYVQGEGSAIYQGVELSACATAHLEALAMATKLYIPPLFCNRSTPDCTAVQHYNPSLRSSVYAEFYDLEHLIYSLQPWAEAEWFSALDEAVFCKYGSNYWMSAIDPKGYLSRYIHYEYISDEDLAHCSFISVYVPMSRHDQLGWTTDYHEMEWYRAAGLSFTGW